MDWKRIGKKLLRPPVWLVLLLSVLSAALLVLVFLQGWEETPLAYAVFALSFYALTVLCIFCAAVLPKRWREIKRRLSENPLGNRYLTEAEFRTRVSLYLSLAINLVYSAIKLVSGIYYASLWIEAVAVYYILLAVMRFLLLRYLHSDKQDKTLEYRRYRLTAVLMLLLNLTLSVLVLHMILKQQADTSSDIIVITSAAYTFYTLTVSMIDIVKYRKYESPVLSAAKAIRFAAALVSLLSLEATMLAHFGQDEGFRRRMLALTGAGVCALVVAMSVYMIVRSSKEIKKIRSHSNG